MRDYDLCEYDDGSLKLSPEKQYLRNRLSSTNLIQDVKAQRGFQHRLCAVPEGLRGNGCLAEGRPL
jgi:hypothetical protein